MNVDHLPGDLVVSFGPRMVRTKCGTISPMFDRIGERGSGNVRLITTGKTRYRDQSDGRFTPESCRLVGLGGRDGSRRDLVPPFVLA
jgi:hypothetical protein